MSMFISNFHFLRPWWLLALAALPALWLALSQRGAQAGAWRAAVDAHLLPHLLADEPVTAASRWPRRLMVLGWTLACFALAGPAWERLPQPLFQNRAARVFALELAPSMAAQDVKPSRYERARFKLDDLLARSSDGQTALIGYAGDAFVVAPLTDDARTVSNLVDTLDPSVMPVAGNDTGRAIDLGVKLIQQAGLDGGQIVLLADSVDGNARSAAQRARAAGVRVSVLGVGSTSGAPVALPQGGFLKDASGNIVLPRLDAAALSAVAQAGGGQYIAPTLDSRDIDAVLASAPSAQADKAAHAQATSARFRDRGPWLAVLLVPLVALGFRRGWLMALPLVLLAHAGPVAAFSWSDLWQRPDQQARAALDAGDAQRAQMLARDPALRGAAAYRAEQYAAASEDFARRDDAQSDYNRGNALAKSGKFEDAIKAYDQALERDPSLADAVANRKAVQDWLKQRQQQQQDQQSKGSQGKQNSQQSAGSESAQQQDPQAQDKSGASQDQQAQHQDGKQQQGEQRDTDANNADKAQNEKSSVDAKQSAQAQRTEQEAAEQFRETMDQALAEHKAQGDQAPKPVRLGAREGKAQNEQEQAVEQWLQRVPDDPGGLLRRKFQLEYEIRRNGGRVPQDEGS